MDVLYALADLKVEFDEREAICDMLERIEDEVRRLPPAVRTALEKYAESERIFWHVFNQAMDAAEGGDR